MLKGLQTPLRVSRDPPLAFAHLRGMGTGASSNPVRLTLNAGLAASRWKSNAHSTHSTHAESNIPSANLQQENDTTLRASDDNLSSNDIKVEGR